MPPPFACFLTVIRIRDELSIWRRERISCSSVSVVLTLWLSGAAPIKRLTEYLTGHGAVGEALGCYCNLHGEIVHVSDNVGISLKDVQMHSHVIAVAGGTVKGEAIVSVMRACRKGTLVIDEGAAEKIMTLI